MQFAVFAVTQLCIYTLSAIVFGASKQFKFVQWIMAFTVFLGEDDHGAGNAFPPVLRFYINLGDLRHIVIIAERLFELNTYESSQLTVQIIDDDHLLLVVGKGASDAP